MNRLLVVIIFSATLVGCGDDRADALIDPAFQELADQFVLDGTSHDHPVSLSRTSIAFDDMIDFTGGREGLGQCHDDGSISISRSFWSAATYAERKTVLYHELGHCILGRAHVDGMDPDKNTPISMMYPTAAIVTSAFIGNEEYYVEELFKNAAH